MHSHDRLKAGFMKHPASGAVSKRYYPLFLDLQDRRCMVIGGGTVGERKIRRLIDYGAQVFLVAEQVNPWIQSCIDSGRVKWVAGSYEQGLLGDVSLVFAATSDKSLNRQIAADARKRGIWCNMATDPDLGDVLLPSILQRGPLCIAFSTGGLAPAVARIVREQFENEFGEEWVAALEFLGRLRSAIRSLELPTSENQRIFRELAALSLQDWIARQNPEAMIHAVHAVCGEKLKLKEIRDLWDGTWKPRS